MAQYSSRHRDSGITATFFSIQDELKQYLLRFLARPQDVEDIIHETFIKAIQSEQRQIIHTPKSFLFKIAKHLALDEIARKSHRVAAHIEDLEEWEVIDDVQTLDEQLHTGRYLEIFRKALTAMPPQCRKVFVMGKVLGYSHLEISRQLDISVSTIEKHIAKGLRICQEHMDNYETRGNHMVTLEQKA